MNIKEAKQEIIDTLKAYLRKDEWGSYLFPTVRQRPILLMGPPGIGKTAIMEQVAKVCGVGLVAYTITHHTRQSAIGLPHIEEKNYRGETMSVTSYTMSEIIASVYETMERTGNREGILFLDEINCVSETLAPTMLQFLQNKTFGSHKVPEGWIIVAAGNPPEYNKSVREFDIVTLDRVRQIDVEADVEVWLEYARKRQLHSAILSYLSVKKDRFYKIHRKAGELSFVTARGWEDLSEILLGYEAMQVKVTERLIRQYLCCDATARDFASYYELFQKYRTDYAIPEILGREVSEEHYREKVNMARQGSLDERLTVVNLLLSTLQQSFYDYIQEDVRVTRLHGLLKQFQRSELPFAEYIAAARRSLAVKKDNDLLTAAEVRMENLVLDRLTRMELEVRKNHIVGKKALYAQLQELFEQDRLKREVQIRQTGEMLRNAFRFTKDSFENGSEMLLLVSGISRMPDALGYISRHGSEEYLRYSGQLLFRQQEQQLQKACQNLL